VPAFRAKKRLGQHFLQSPAIVHRILQVVNPQPGKTIVEIGPGRGALTLPLAESGAHVVAVEFDRDVMRHLKSHLKRFDNIELINEDFLRFNPQAHGLTRFTLVGNLPFNITSPVIEWIIEHRRMIDSACLMVQKEMGARLSACPKSKDWSPLSIFTQLHFEVSYCFDVPPEHFRPRPKVTSAVIQLVPADNRHVEHFAEFEKVVRAAFQRRRKLLVNNLVPDMIPQATTARDLLSDLGLPEKARAEELSIEQFLRLTQCLIEHKIL
jgi:16S rRNA (adenine1518-N6/adenine1519-N6)-dimethyltransferase